MLPRVGILCRTLSAAAVGVVPAARTRPFTVLGSLTRLRFAFGDEAGP